MTATIQIKNWSKFQHYKDRCPPWIKLATDTFQNPEFARLQDASKLLAICIWTLGSRSKDGRVPDDFSYIKQWGFLGVSVTESHLNELIDKGFIIRASGLLAAPKQNAIPETETETEGKKKRLPPTGEKNNGNGNGRVSDPRHTPFKELICICYAALNDGQKPPWGVSEAAQLALLLKEKPDLTETTMKQWLNNYYHSKNHPPGLRPRAFIPNLCTYTREINKFNREEEAQ